MGRRRNRSKIAAANGITGYSGSAAQNTRLLELLKQGRLARPGASTAPSLFSRMLRPVQYGIISSA